MAGWTVTSLSAETTKLLIKLAAQVGCHVTCLVACKLLPVSCVVDGFQLQLHQLFFQQT